MSSGILPSFLGALQASLAVLLTISYGAIASRFNLLKESSSRDISKTCVRLLLPALLITNVGKELHADTVHRYVPVLSKLPQHAIWQYLITSQSGPSFTHFSQWAWVGSSNGRLNSLRGPYLLSASSKLLEDNKLFPVRASFRINFSRDVLEKNVLLFLEHS